jgi:hypothetical protein
MRVLCVARKHICILRNYTQKNPFSFSPETHTSLWPLIKAKYTKAQMIKHPRECPHLSLRIQKTEKNSLKSLCMVYLKRDREEKVINIPLFMSLSERNRNWLFCWVAFFSVWIYFKIVSIREK